MILARAKSFEVHSSDARPMRTAAGLELGTVGLRHGEPGAAKDPRDFVFCELRAGCET